MCVSTKVLVVWRELRRRERRIMKALSRGSPDAVLRCRCKVILALVQGKTPTMIQEGGLCSSSQVYRVADRFIEQGPQGLPDRREDNGENKVTELYELELLSVLTGSPRDHGYLRPTWTQELLVRVLAARTGITVSVTTMSRLLKRHRVRLGSTQASRGLPMAESTPNAATGVDSTADPEPGPGRSRRVRGRGGHSSEPQDRTGLDATR